MNYRGFKRIRSLKNTLWMHQKWMSNLRGCIDNFALNQVNIYSFVAGQFGTVQTSSTDHKNNRRKFVFEQTEQLIKEFNIADSRGPPFFVVATHLAHTHPYKGGE